MIKNCEQCGKQFEWSANRRYQQRYCSRDCFLDNRRRPALQSGTRFGRLVVLGYSHTDNRKQPHYRCKCECGNHSTPKHKDLIDGLTQSCGCLHRERAAEGKTTHGASYTREYKSFKAARRRCTNSNDTQWHNYGGRGIEFRFSNFEEWYAELGPKPTRQHSVDRINNDGHYEPGNVRWATSGQQAKNKRPRNGPP